VPAHLAEQVEAKTSNDNQRKPDPERRTYAAVATGDSDPPGSRDDLVQAQQLFAGVDLGQFDSVQNFLPNSEFEMAKLSFILEKNPLQETQPSESEDSPDVMNCILTGLRVNNFPVPLPSQSGADKWRKLSDRAWTQGASEHLANALGKAWPLLVRPESIRMTIVGERQAELAQGYRVERDNRLMIITLCLQSTQDRKKVLAGDLKSFAIHFRSLSPAVFFRSTAEGLRAEMVLGQRDSSNLIQLGTSLKLQPRALELLLQDALEHSGAAGQGVTVRMGAGPQETEQLAGSLTALCTRIFIQGEGSTLVELAASGKPLVLALGKGCERPVQVSVEPQPLSRASMTALTAAHVAKALRSPVRKGNCLVIGPLLRSWTALGGKASMDQERKLQADLEAAHPNALLRLLRTAGNGTHGLVLELASSSEAAELKGKLSVRPGPLTDATGKFTQVMQIDFPSALAQGITSDQIYNLAQSVRSPDNKRRPAAGTCNRPNKSS
jgi:hypothetical protein